MQKELLVFGSFTKDFLENHKGDKRVAIGGSSAYFSISTSLVGLKVYPVGFISTDINEEELETLSKIVDLRYLKREKRLNFHIKYDENLNAHYIKDLEENDEIIEYKNVPIKPYVHVCVISSIRNQMDIIEYFKDKGSFVSTGTYLIRVNKDRETVLKMLKLSDLFFLNRDEALSLSQKENFDDALEFFKNSQKMVVITLGKDGAIFIKGEEFFKVNAYKTEVVDPTGAGETFAGGFLASYILYGNPLLSLKYGTLLSSFVIEDFGISALLKIKREDILKRLEEIK
ncbi:MAG: PfkB family carbohydrate kinase [Caldisericia bacterium]|jgi:sugar/nucleoside kinase (ribokinase family)|nr:PfkB family carbohydrate kinase [Caldisericia bacterium]